MLIRFILFLLFFYLIYFLIKYIFIRPFKEGYSGGGQRQQRGRGRQQNPFNREKEGDVSITYDPRKQKNGKEDVGEYVDYEEVKE